MIKMKYKIEDEGMRLDKYLTSTLEESRSQILKMIKNKEITLNNKYPKAGEILKKNDIIEINHKKEEKEIKSEDLNLEIVYEDDDVIVVNKPNGMVVHPAPGNYSGTLVNGLMYHTKLSDINGELRPGIVHRIDAYTTGLLMVAKNNKAHQILADELAKKETHRKYIALVWGVIPNDTGTINAPIGRNPNDRKKMAIMPNGKKAITHFKVIKRYKNATLIELELETGRTHQIRVHMDYIKHPVVNDPVYGKRKIIDNTGQCLHAKELGFKHPKTNKYMLFTSEIPQSFTNILNKFEEGEQNE
ncbi:MAG: RluA family pseudouridine synthase [Bacilli bacterium]|nr:RluA family pseudouridine synthase [Bacilli bacterium]